MKKQIIVIIFCLIVLMINGCVSMAKNINSLHLETILIGNTLINDDTNESYIFLPDGDLIYLYGKTGKKDAGKWFIKKAFIDKEESDVICTPHGKTIVKFSKKPFRCTKLVDDGERDNRNRRIFRGKIAQCYNESEKKVNCTPLFYNFYISFTLVEPIAIEENISHRFSVIESDSDIVNDSQTGLQWMKCTLGQESFSISCQTDAKIFNKSFTEVEQYINKFNLKGLEGYNDWRLPTYKELTSLVKCQNGKQPLKDEICSEEESDEERPKTYSIFSTIPGIYLTSDRKVEGRGDYLVPKKNSKGETVFDYNDIKYKYTVKLLWSVNFQYGGGGSGLEKYYFTWTGTYGDVHDGGDNYVRLVRDNK